jgi:ferredoxin-thioredoxin reductase catalytic subunit
LPSGRRAISQEGDRRAATSCPGVKWRATIDEDGQYCFIYAKSEKEDLTDAERREIRKLGVALEAEG